AAGAAQNEHMGGAGRPGRGGPAYAGGTDDAQDLLRLPARGGGVSADRAQSVARRTTGPAGGPGAAGAADGQHGGAVPGGVGATPGADAGTVPAAGGAGAGRVG